MAKRRRTRRQKKKQRQLSKNRSGQGWPRRGQPAAVSFPIDEEMTEALAPLLSGSEEQAAQKLTNALFESDRFADEPELEEIIFDPEVSALIFIKTSEEMGWTAADYFDAKEEIRGEVFAEIAEQIVPVLLTEELRQEILDCLDSLIQRYQRQHQRKRAAQATFIRLILADQNQKQMWPMVELLQRIASRSIEAGFAWMGMMDEISQEAPDVLDMPVKLAQSKAVSHIAKTIERIPGLRRLAEKRFDQIMTEAETAVYDGTLHLGLFTEDELATAGKIMEKHIEPFAREGKSPEDLPDKTGRAMIAEMDTYLLQLLTPERLSQMQKRLNTIMNNSLVAEKWLGIVGLLYENLGAEDAVEMERPFLFRVLMGEISVGMLTQQEEEL